MGFNSTFEVFLVDYELEKFLSAYVTIRPAEPTHLIFINDNNGIYGLSLALEWTARWADFLGTFLLVESWRPMGLFLNFENNKLSYGFSRATFLLPTKSCSVAERRRHCNMSVWKKRRGLSAQNQLQIEFLIPPPTLAVLRGSTVRKIPAPNARFINPNS